jgi:two-component system response regulator DevR
VTSYVSKYLRVYLLDDHDIVRQGLRDLLAPSTDILVVGDSGSAKAAAQAIPELSVDVMVLDLRLQDGTGVEVCRAVRAVSPSVKGLLLTSSDDDEALVAAILAGASGYLVKLTRSSDITTAIRKVGAGRPLIDATTAERVGQQLMADAERLEPPLDATARRLLAQVVAGLTDNEIADAEGSSVEVVAAEVAALVERVLRPEPSSRAAELPGRHRRADS